MSALSNVIPFNRKRLALVRAARLANARFSLSVAAKQLRLAAKDLRDDQDHVEAIDDLSNYLDDVCASVAEQHEMCLLQAGE